MIKEGTPEGGAYSEGMHQAIDHIMTAMKNLESLSFTKERAYVKKRRKRTTGKFNG